MSVHRHYSFLQGNLNHCARAQDIALQSMAEWAIDIAVFAEPYFVPPQPRWAGDMSGLVTIVTKSDGSIPLVVKERGEGYVAVHMGDIAIIGVYFSPNRSLREFEDFLDVVRNAVNRVSPRQTFVLGDLNAKSRAWGNPNTNPKGRATQIWAVLSGLALLNRGNTNTCVRRRGGSVVDVTFATRPLHNGSLIGEYWKGWRLSRIIYIYDLRCPPITDTQQVRFTVFHAGQLLNWTKI
jgi:hypothetical protein